MRVITHCPACQTQFFATEEQLNQHDGKVRCGQCMHVFDARAQLVHVADHPPNASDSSGAVLKANSATDDEAANKQASATASVKARAKKSKNADTKPEQPAYLDDNSGKSKLKRQLPTRQLNPWLWLLATIVVFLLAITQSIYFLRNDIAIYYPQFKPLLNQACKTLHCTITLPEQIEFIVIDDSDMQEDPERSGLIYFSTHLINTGNHTVAYPDLELTLTDTGENPVLRRLFKPSEYLPQNLAIEEGFKFGAEINIKLAITTSDAKVSGYRVFVTY